MPVLDPGYVQRFSGVSAASKGQDAGALFRSGGRTELVALHPCFSDNLISNERFSALVTTAPSPLLAASVRSTGHRMSLVCFPYAGANPYLFVNWRPAFAPRIDVVGVHLPGRGNRLRQPSHRSIGEIVSETVDALAGLGDRPFAFYGHSLGALIAFETARHLRRLGRPQPAQLFVGGARPPHMPALTPHLHGLGPSDFLASVQARYGGIPAAILEEPELLEIFMPALRADFEAYETYEHEAGDPLACPIFAFAGSDDLLVTADMMAEWERHTTSDFELSVLPGGHFFLAPESHQLLADIRSKLP